MRCFYVLTVGLTAGAFAVPSAQSPSFQNGIDVVQATVTVRDRDGQFVSGLDRHDLTVFEEGRRREIVGFADESAPVSVGLLVDASGSMDAAKLRLARESITRLVADEFEHRVEWFFARFGYSVVVAQEWTTDRDAIVQPLRELRGTGDTALNDAIALAVPLVDAGRFQKKALLVVSDGGETKSLLSVEQVLDAIGARDIRVYAFGIGGASSGTVDMKVLRRVSDETGGWLATVTDAASAKIAAARLGNELRHEYVISYATDTKKDGRSHAIRVSVQRPRVTVTSRRRFVAN